MKLEKESIERNLDKVMALLDFDKTSTGYECGSNNIAKKEVIKVLARVGFEETGDEWYSKGKQSINVIHLVKAIEILKLLS